MTYFSKCKNLHVDFLHALRLKSNKYIVLNGTDVPFLLHP